MATRQTEGAVVLLSGGLDSTALLFHVVRELNRAPVHTLSIRYGQRHARELECARYQSAAAGAESHRELDFGALGGLLRAGSTLIAGGAPVPDIAALSADELKHPPTYVPNRNMMLLSIAAAYAEAQGMAAVYYGAQAQDDYGYWDCTHEFLLRMNEVLKLNRGIPVAIHAPLIFHSKLDNLRLGLKLGVDFAHTWSCYRGEERACGTCPTCHDRLAAFTAAGFPDPLPYAGATI